MPIMKQQCRVWPYLVGFCPPGGGGGGGSYNRSRCDPPPPPAILGSVCPVRAMRTIFTLNIPTLTPGLGLGLRLGFAGVGWHWGLGCASEVELEPEIELERELEPKLEPELALGSQSKKGVLPFGCGADELRFRACLSRSPCL